MEMFCQIFNIFFCKIRNQMNATIPFSILEMLIAHQTPVMPSPIAVNPIAIGIRRLLNVMLMMAGGACGPYRRIIPALLFPAS